MSKVRLIQRPPREGTSVTLSDARAVFRDLNNLVVVSRKTRTSRNPAKKVLKFRVAKAARDAVLGKK